MLWVLGPERLAALAAFIILGAVASATGFKLTGSA